MADQKKKSGQIYDKTSPLEIASELGRGVVDSALDVATSIPQKAVEQLLGIPARNGNFSGEMVIGRQAQSLELKAQKAEEKLKKLELKFHNEVGRGTQEVYNFQKQQEQQKIQAIVQSLSIEVKSIQLQAAALSGDVKKVTVEQAPSADKYHLNFFEWVLAMLRDIKKDIVKSRTWLQAFNGKNKKKGYWAMFKKHGTSFAMSDERGIATAAG